MLQEQTLCGHDVADPLEVVESPDRAVAQVQVK